MHRQPTVTVTIEAGPAVAQALQKLGLHLTTVRPGNGCLPTYAITIPPEQIPFLGDLTDTLTDLRLKHLGAVQELRGGGIQLPLFPGE